MATPSPAPFVVPDHRCPGQPMATLPVKVPPVALEQLQAMADRLGCNRTALARTLLLQGLAQLQAGATPGPY